MNVYMISCPKTGEQVTTGVAAAGPLDQRIANKTATMKCPACGEQHVWTLGGARVGQEATMPSGSKYG
jgi:hypothetical protein